MTGRRKLPRACNNGGTPTSPSSSSTTRTTMSAGKNMKQTTAGNNNTEEENAMNFFKNILEERKVTDLILSMVKDVLQMKQFIHLLTV